MTPKEKAIELVENFAETLPPIQYNQLVERDWYTSKQCALIAVDEILNCYNWPSSELEFYNEVKQEIEKL